MYNVSAARCLQKHEKIKALTSMSLKSSGSSFSFAIQAKLWMYFALGGDVCAQVQVSEF